MKNDTTHAAHPQPLPEVVEGALQILAGRRNAGKLRRLALLARQVTGHTTPTALADLPAETLADLLEELLHGVEKNETAPLVRLLPLPQPGRFWLVTCATDVPYLFDALAGLVKRNGIRFRVVAHPVVYLRGEGSRRHLVAKPGRAVRMALAIFELHNFVTEQESDLIADVCRAIRGMQRLATDQAALVARLAQLEPLAQSAGHEDFWHWLRAGSFESLAYRCLAVRRDRKGQLRVRQEGGSSLGFFPIPWEYTCGEEHVLHALPASLQGRLKCRQMVVATVGSVPNPVCADEPLLFVTVRETLSERHWREHDFAGMQTAYGRRETNTALPFLRRRIRQVMHSLGILAHSHDWRKTRDMLDNFPTIELFFLGQPQLRRIVRALTQLYRDGTVKVVVMPGLAGSGLTLMIMLPRRFFSSANLQRMRRYLGRALQTDDFSLHIARDTGETVSLHVRCPGTGRNVRVDPPRLERSLTRIGRPWEELLGMLLERRHGPREGVRLTGTYLAALSREYRALVHPRFALRDIEALEKLLRSGTERFALWGPLPGQDGSLRLQFYSLHPCALGEILPVLENLSLQVRENVDFTVAGQPQRYIKSFAVALPANVQDTAAVRERLLDALAAVRLTLVENDGLNRLMTMAGLDWRQVDVLRAYRDYYLQIGGPESRSRVAEALVNNAAVTRLLLHYFLTRFQDSAKAEDLPDREERLLQPLRQALVEALDVVRDIHEDAVLRALFNLIDATVRCNYFTRGERSGWPLAFKIAAMGVIGLTAPQPLYEIFVHSASLAAIHLRGGKVARGGIRWCDRLATLRTEVLGLMKTQMIKNAMIVPVGSKGGFYVKRPYREREEGARLAAQAYRDFMRGLLDLTDNRVNSTVQRPIGLVTYDQADTYLVVAADKGTAHLSDTANAVAAEYGYWLGDAFASGGSHGYDHKQLAITARGAWTCVRRHLYELGRDPRDGLTVIGIGDMSGDVFGNGLLLSDRIRLVAAFDHRHIFLDPDPDPKRSFAERRRLFRLERSCWADYDPTLISAGGGVFARDAKDIRLSPQVCRLLRVCHRSVDGPGLIRLILAAPADLLWNGGIGTYIKAEGETHQDALDPANDPVRIDARQLRVMVVGEGGNLGLTQRARIQFSLSGGLINLDAVDNAGGVACSDREVNLKIFLRQLLDRGEISSLEERDHLLAELVDEVCEAVLADCDQQALCLSLDQARCGEGLESFLAQAESLVNGDWLDRDENHLPDHDQVLSRATPSLTRPELAVLMAGSKMQLYHALLADGLPDSSLGRHYLHRYFPEPLRTRFSGHLADHSLAREIAATVMTNTVINQAGSAFAGRLSRQTGVDLARVATLYLLFDRMLEGPRLRRALKILENRWPFQRQRALLLNLEDTLEVFCRWALVLHLDISLENSVLHSFRRDLVGFFDILDGILPPARQQTILAQRQQLVRDGLEDGLARLAVMLDDLGDFLPAISLALRTGRDLSSVARTLVDIRCFLGLDELARQLESVSAREHWDRLARQTLRSKYDALAFDFALAVWHEAAGDRQAYFAARRCRLRTLREQQARLRGGPADSYHPFVVLVGTLESLLGPGYGQTVS